MNLKNLTQSNLGIEDAITPIDGRNRYKIKELTPYVTETALNKYRVLIELEYILRLSQNKIIPAFSKKEISKINSVIANFKESDHKRIKDIESKTRHDVKAVEYYLREQFQSLGLEKYNCFLHIGLTSEDINNLAYGLILKDVNANILIPQLELFLRTLKNLIKETAGISVLGRTHGQPAVTTTIGKELANYYKRLEKQLSKLKKFVFEGKLNGAVGNFNAMSFAYPKTDWIRFSKNLIQGLDLEANIFTTQILACDNWLDYFHILTMINGIILDMSINMWNYIMLEIFRQKNLNTVGSSTMPQKINPIDFERAEGHTQLANAHFHFYQQKLISSRLQRDLSDSTVKRTFGSAIGYTLLAWKDVQKGLDKVYVNTEHIANELSGHWEILGEALQTYLRSKGDKNAYETVKTAMQGKIINKPMWQEILSELKLEKEKKLVELTPEKYIGLAVKLAKMI